MGQYYHIINIDKKEYIKPHDMKSSTILTELGESTCGPASALAVLLASGNGRGGGDLAWTGCEGEKGWISDISKHEHLRFQSTFVSGGKNCATIVPKIAGRWAGDRIVVAGDYGDKGAFMPSRQLTRKEIGWIAKERNATAEKIRETFKTTGDLNLRELSNMSFKNITKDVVKAMKFDEEWKKCFAKLKKEGK